MLKSIKDHLEKTKNLLDIPLDAVAFPLDEFPRGWTKTFYKIYPRFPKTPLETDKKITPMNQILIDRKSVREFGNTPLSFRTISNILFWSCGENKILKNESFIRRMYPSGGHRYPIEVYAVNINIKDIKKGIHHYNVKENSLEAILEEDVSKDMFGLLSEQFRTASVLLILTTVLSRQEIKYGSRALMLSLIEAGHVGQNIYLKCQEENVECCGVVGFDRDSVSKLLDLDSEEEVPIYCFAIGTTNSGGK